jgi:ribonuclease PH
VDAIEWGKEKSFISSKKQPISDSIAAISVGIVDAVPFLDLAYTEDVRAETDMNVVVTGSGKFVEVQGTAEKTPFDRVELDALLDLALKGTKELTAIQQEVLRTARS